MNIEDYLEQPCTVVKFDPKNKDHVEHLTYSKEAMNHSVLQTMDWLAGCGISINPAQC